MARKKAEIQLQVEVETQEEWEEMLSKEGLTVVDIYQEWSGPCKAMISNFRKFKMELGDDLLRFAVAKSDTVDALERYRGKCEPCFLFFAGGVLVSVIRGANSPLLQKSIVDQLGIEHRVLDGSIERKEIRDPLVTAGDREDTGEDDGEEEETDEMKKGVSVAIIKPDLVQAGKVEEIIEKMKEHGIEILEQEERQLTADEVKEFYAHLTEESEDGQECQFEFFDQLVEFMSSGPSVILVITKGEAGTTIIEEWRELLGPTSVEDAKENAPDSLRAQYGTETYVNALHGSDSQETAMRELAFFFPSFSVPTLNKKSAKPSTPARVQRTLALIRPDALAEKKDEILAKIEESGFTVAMQKEMQLTKEQAEAFYSEHRGQPYFDELTTCMSNGPLLALALAREDAVDSWRGKLGPKEVEKAQEAPESLRAQFSVEGVPVNPLHGSDSVENAQKEIEYFFGPVEQTVAVIKPDSFQTQDDIMNKIKEAGFNIAARKQTELTKEIAEQFYSDLKDKDYYGDLTEHMTSGPTLFMVLSRENAVDGWRSLIGPTDPEKAKEEAPETLRAQFGHDIKANAVHGSSNQEQVQESIKLVFGDVEFTRDGMLKEKAEAQTTEGSMAPADGQQTEEGTEQTEQSVEQTEQSVEQTEQSVEQTEQSAEQTEQQEQSVEQQEQTEQAAEPADGEQAAAAPEQTPATPAAQETPATPAPAAEPAAQAAEEGGPPTEQQQAVEEPTEQQAVEATLEQTEQQEMTQEPVTEQAQEETDGPASATEPAAEAEPVAAPEATQEAQQQEVEQAPPAEGEEQKTEEPAPEAAAEAPSSEQQKEAAE